MEKNLINEVRQLQKIAGILKEDEDLDIRTGDNVSVSYEGEPAEFGTVVDVANNWDEALQKGGDNFKTWEMLFNNEEAVTTYGYNSFEDWQNKFVNRLKSNKWYKVDTEEYNTSSEGWFPAEYVEKD